MKKRPSISILAIVAASIIWGISFLSIKMAVSEIRPIMLAFLRFSIAAIVLLFLIFIRKKSLHIQKKDVPRFIFSGFLGITAYYGFQNHGILRLPAATAALIVGSIPIFALLIDRIFWGHKMGLAKILAVGLSFAGVYLTLNLTGQGTLDWIGVLCMFGAVLTWIFFCFFTTPLYNDYDQLVIVFYQTIFGSVLFLPLIFLEGLSPIHWTGALLGHVVFLGAICSGIGYFLYIYALKDLGIAKASLFLNLLPLVTILSSALVLKEHMNLRQMAGAILILVSVFMVSMPKKQKTNNRLP